jgi:hypothetical protein
MTVKIDGNAVPGALVDTEIPTDPGEHAVDVTAPGFLRSSTHVSVGEGEKKSVTVTLSRDPNATAATPPAAAAAQPTAATSPARRTAAPAAALAPAPAEEHGTSHTAAYVSLGIGGAALAVGGVLGFMTIQRHKTLKNDCPNDTCTRAQQSDIDSAKRLGNMSTVAFGVGGAGLVLGTVLLFTGGSSQGDHAKTESTRFAGLSRPHVAFGPTQVELGAEF